MSMEYKAAAFKMSNEPSAEGVFEGYASVFDIVDQGLDVVKRGAFQKSLDRGKPVRMLWQHDPYEPIGKWEEIREDERGLFVRGRLIMDVPRAKAAASLMKAGAIDSMSIGYRTIEAMAGDNPRVRELTEIDLLEVSVVTFPMLPAAKVTDVKSIADIRTFEQALREAGFTRSEAKAIAARGFKGFSDVQREAVAPDEPDTEGLAALLSEIRLLQENISHA